MPATPTISKETPMSVVIEYEVGTHLKLAQDYAYETFATNAKSYAHTQGRLFEVSYVSAGTAAYTIYGVNTVVVRANEQLPLA